MADTPAQQSTDDDRAAWRRAYRREFVAFAVSRGWDRLDAMSWAGEIHAAAAAEFWPQNSPAFAARHDVPLCEWEAANV